MQKPQRPILIPEIEYDNGKLQAVSDIKVRNLVLAG